MNKIEFKKFLFQKKVLATIIAIMALVFSFLNKHTYDVQEWDEARNGVNAYEMLQNKDFVNLYYQGKPDTWNAKPPLMIWLIAGSYSLFGFNEFALRFPTAVAVFLFFILCFKTISLLDKPIIAFGTCLILMSCKAIFGNHIGLTADFDALLLLFLSASVYFFIRFIELGKQHEVLLVALFTGLAFYTKGPASMVLLPGCFLYVFIKKSWGIFKMWQTWGALLLLITMVLSWFYISKKYGLTTTDSYYGSTNSIETMLLHDTFQRLTNPAFDITGNQSNIYLFFFEVIDARLNLWNYVFYLGIITAVVMAIRNKKSMRNYFLSPGSKMSLLSASLILPLALVLTFASTKNNWYLAPLFMYIAYLTTKTIFYYGSKSPKYFLLFAAVFVFTFIRQTFYLATLSTDSHVAFWQNKDLANKKVLAIGSLRQDIILYLKWANAKIVSETEYESLLHKEEINFILNENHLDHVFPGKQVQLLKSFNGYRIGKLIPAN